MVEREQRKEYQVRSTKYRGGTARDWYSVLRTRYFGLLEWCTNCHPGRDRRVVRDRSAQWACTGTRRPPSTPG